MSEAHSSLQRALTFLDKNADNGKLDQADSKLRRARLITKSADILKIEKKHADSEAQYKEALDILMKALGPDHSELSPTLEGYADLLMSTYREQEAEHMLSCARALTKKP